MESSPCSRKMFFLGSIYSNDPDYSRSKGVGIFNGYLLVSETHCQSSLSVIGDVLERKVNVSTAKSFAKVK